MTDPFIVEQVRENVGLNFYSPDHVLMLCVDEKSQIQALERTQRNLPVGPGYVEGITYDYARGGGTTHFSVLDARTGEERA